MSFGSFTGHLWEGPSNHALVTRINHSLSYHISVECQLNRPAHCVIIGDHIFCNSSFSHWSNDLAGQKIACHTFIRTTVERQIEVRITPINTMLMNGPVCEVQMKVGCCKADYIRLTVRGCVEGKSDLKLCV